MSFFSGSVPFSISSLSVKPSPSVSVVGGVTVFPSTGTSTTSVLPSAYVTSTLTTSFPLLFAPPFALWSVPSTTFPSSSNFLSFTCVPSGTFTASLTFCTSSAFVTFPSFTGVSLNFAVSAVGVVFAAVFPSTGTSTTSVLPSPYVTSTLTTSFPLLFAPPFALWSVPATTFPPSTNSFVGSFCPSGTVTFTASLIFCTSSAFVTFPSFTGVSLSFAVSAVGVVFAAVSPSTGTSISLVIPSRVTFTGTTFLPSFSVIFPYSTVSVSLSSSPFAVTLAFTFAWSFSVKLSPTLGSTEIFAAPSFTANVKSSALPDKAVLAFCSFSSAASTSTCIAAVSFNTIFASFRALSYSSCFALLSLR